MKSDGGKVIGLPTRKSYTITDDIVDTLAQLLADVKSGKVTPFYLILGWGEKVEVNGQPGSAYNWDATGLETPEVIGHLTTYATKLAMGEGEE